SSDPFRSPALSRESRASAKRLRELENRFRAEWNASIFQSLHRRIQSTPASADLHAEQDKALQSRGGMLEIHHLHSTRSRGSELRRASDREGFPAREALRRRSASSLQPASTFRRI